ncbi:MAG: hypothetical protein IJA02_09835 [Clostridia bacterium]|nr:hypothetical protein [Clostridia bacterium]MBR6620173.1 hypothetical protein [Clostridia bacterium]
MKKIIVAVLVIAVLAGAGLIGWNVYEKEVIMAPENLIVGEWTSGNGIYSLVFTEEGVASGNLDVPLLGVVSFNGNYTVDEEASTITIVYSLYSISYTDTKTFVLTEDTLTLTDTGTGVQTSYTRLVPESGTQNAA